ncbi:MAG: acyl-CoA dehydrogenase family protein [Legionellaceae bacterium]|nr:acyl-CoA dehydrogenase family protein [Legionellaceae bacterium]
MDDLLYLDDSLQDDEKILRDTVSEFVTRSVLPRIADAFEQQHFPTQWINDCATLGLFGLTLPEAYGGSLASYTAYGLVCQELEKGDSALRSLVSVQSSLCMYPIFRFGTEAQKQHFLPKMAKGEIIGCFGLTEPNAGSDPASMKTVAKKVTGGYRLQGSKMWITNAPIADIAIVWAHTDEGIRAFLVEKDRPGFSRLSIKHKMSLRASPTGELSLSDVFIPDENLLPGTQKGLSTALACLQQARLGIAWGALGAAMQCFDVTLAYLQQRQQFNKPLSSCQLIQKDLSDMYADLLKAQCLNRQLARLQQENRVSPVMVSISKRESVKTALDISRKCRNLLGANGISLEYQVIRHMLNLESVFTYEGTDNIHTLIIGKHLTGIAAF